MARSRVLGAQSLRRKLKRMPDKVKKPAQDGVRDGMEIVYADALSRVPVDQGDLARSLHRRLSSDKLGARIGYWKKGNIRRWLKGGWRAKFVEFGTRGNSEIPPQPARPFLGPAARANTEWIISRIRNGVNTTLKRASRL